MMLSRTGDQFRLKLPMLLLLLCTGWLNNLMLLYESPGPLALTLISCADRFCAAAVLLAAAMRMEPSAIILASCCLVITNLMLSERGTAVAPIF
ncbi:hypothetical protein Mapa_015895 [Marchantia paleacea]|nr:hypothetical protein Mapa_015895 [Marchantia paleacea]